jgi:hypothetical protein
MLDQYYWCNVTSCASRQCCSALAMPIWETLQNLRLFILSFKVCFHVRVHVRVLSVSMSMSLLMSMVMSMSTSPVVTYLLFALQMKTIQIGEEVRANRKFHLLLHKRLLKGVSHKILKYLFSMYG